MPCGWRRELLPVVSTSPEYSPPLKTPCLLLLRADVLDPAGHLPGPAEEQVRRGAARPLRARRPGGLLGARRC